MVNEEIAEIFEKISKLLAFKGADHFRILAYQRAATSLRELGEDLITLAQAGKLQEIPGIGKDLAAMITEYIKYGRIERYERESRGVPEGLIALMDIPGLGPKTLAQLYENFHIKNLADLERLLTSDALLELHGFGKKRVENLQRGIKLWKASQQRLSIGIALPLAEKLLDEVRKISLVEHAEAAGSIRRRRETIGDLDLLIISQDSTQALAQIAKLPIVRQVLALGDTRASVIIDSGLQVDIRAVAEESYGAALQYFTGSKQHNVHLRTIALAHGLKVNEYGIFRGTRRLGGNREEDIYRLLGLKMMPPELREDRGEIEASLTHNLPVLIELADLRGDLHTHTTYSDGKSTIEEMVEQAAVLGYQYIALTDHSPSVKIAHGVELARLEKKIEEIEKLRVRRGNRAPHILIGSEVDILADGRLDYPDEVLARLDVIVASIHSAFQQNRDRMTGRLLDAIANPYVHIIGHPTTRHIGSRAPVEFDFERVIASAVAAGVALEINASPYRLDLNETMARTAQEAGVLLAIDSDAHHTTHLEQIRYGIYQARRGWIRPESVINTWSWAKLSRWLRHRTHGTKLSSVA
ncbi:MAG: DNA polymerase/3'-5' exonuclease PolX [Acidobacteriota bacterium]